jgi:lysophospholipase L1-like esterase
VTTRRLLSAVVIAILGAGCGKAPVAPTPDLRISCPAPPTATATGPTAVVSYNAPTVTGGSAPVSVTCSPPSGSTFTVGTSPVTCTARDAQQRSDSCGFAVTVQRTPVIAATRFVAFGDSITYGVLPSCEMVSPGVFDLQRDLPLLLQAVNIPASYPTKLQALLASRYSSQSPVVLNEGEAGETVQRGVARLPGVVAADAPHVLLLQEGVNNINGGNPAESSTVADGLRAMVRAARSRGIQVFLATLLPERAGGCRARAPALISPTNDLIRGVANAEGATLVDLYQAFAGMESTLLGIDGLHPTEAGYDKMAQTFFDAIRPKLEETGVGRR